MINALSILNKELRNVADTIVKNGWGEATAGNISINVTALTDEKDLVALRKGTKHVLQENYPQLAGEVLLISASGSRMRSMVEELSTSVCFLLIEEGGAEYWQLPGKIDIAERPPTSELPAHLAVHHLLKSTGRPEKVLLHTHMTEAVELTHHPDYTTEKLLNKELYNMQPEMMTFLPGGVGLIPYFLPGSSKLAIATAEKFKNHGAALWEKHGCLTTGATANEALDRQEMIAKAIKVLLMCLSAGFKPQGLTGKQLAELEAMALNK
jgi:rhamnulose-1-phosphate aldolase